MKQHLSLRSILLGIGSWWFLCLNLLLLLLLLLYFPAMSHADLNSDRKALLSLKTALGGRLRRSWNISSPTCSWVGVVCDENNVIELHFPGMGLKGQLPLGTIGNLTHLQIISLRFNSIVAPIPSDFINLASLQTLQLEGNSLSGNIPDVFFSLQSLTNLSLASNKFTGDIPLSFNNLTKLVSLDLEKNQLTGLIPDLDLQLDRFNVSHNQLSGAIPSRFSGMPESAFEGNLQLCDKPLKPCNGTDNSDGGGGGGGGSKGDGGSKLKRGAVAGIVIACVLGFILILLLLFAICCCCSRKGVSSSWGETAGSTPKRVDQARGIQLGGKSVSPSPPPAEPISISSSSDGINNNNNKEAGGRKLVFLGKQLGVDDGAFLFELEDLLRAPSEVLGRGAYGTSYKAEVELGDGSVVNVVVKRLREVKLTARVFKERIREIGSLEHENLVSPRAYYYGMQDEKLLVLDYVALGSLSAILHGGDTAAALSWEARCRIALGAARGIAYIHSQLRPAAAEWACCYHGNIKSSNILLTETYEARVTDFGLPILACPTTTTPMSRFQGYVAPAADDDDDDNDDDEMKQKQKLQAADTYSYGVLLLELLTGKDPNSAQVEDHEEVDEYDDGKLEHHGQQRLSLSRWVHLKIKSAGGTLSSVFDPQLLRYQPNNVEEEDMVRLLRIALDCTHQHPPTRPSMSQVLRMITPISASSIHRPT